MHYTRRHARLLSTISLKAFDCHVWYRKTCQTSFRDCSYGFWPQCRGPRGVNSVTVPGVEFSRCVRPDDKWKTFELWVQIHGRSTTKVTAQILRSTQQKSDTWQVRKHSSCSSLWHNTQTIKQVSNKTLLRSWLGRFFLPPVFSPPTRKSKLIFSNLVKNINQWNLFKWSSINEQSDLF